MANKDSADLKLEIGHVLFMDIVGYSKLPINQQRALVVRLNQIVRGTDEFHLAETAGRLLTIPTGDGIMLVFYHSPEAPAECALEISRALKKHPELQLRMGVHSGPVSGVIDATGKANAAGPGINMPTRGILPVRPIGCCARAASGHATVVPLISVMNSRRLMFSLKAEDGTLPHR